MKLNTLKLKNFRGYKEAVIDLSDDLNLIIGRNDVGKSTIMDALEIFFNGDGKSPLVKAEIGDRNVFSKEKYFEIACVFEVEDGEDITIDSTYSTSLKDEFLLNRSEQLEIVKKWSCTGASLTASSLSVNLKAYYPKLAEEPFILLKRDDLKKKLALYEKEIADYKDIDKTTNAIMRKALFKHLINDTTEYEEVDIEIKKLESASGDKNIWKRLKDNLPLFFLFQSDRSNSDSDGEVQNPLKIATKKALAELQEKLDAIKEEVHSVVSLIGDQTIEKLKEFDEGIASRLKTNLNLKAWDSVFSFDLVSDDDIPLNKRGSGVRRLILLSYFRAEAERISTENNSKKIIYAIEEPETAQHPDFQKMILESLTTIANDSNHQVLITTHTPEIAKLVEIEKIVFIQKVDGFPVVVNDDVKKMSMIAQSLGVLPTIQSRVVICVEGENDVNFLRNINQTIPELKALIDLEVEEISIIPLSGSKLITWINKNYLKNSNVLEYHIYDSDVQAYIDEVKKICEENDGRRYAVNTTLLEMENYIPPKLVESEFRIELGEHKEQWLTLDIPKHLTNLVMTGIKDMGEREKVIKTRLNGKLTKLITKEDLEEMGTYEEIESWFKEVSNLYHVGSLNPNIELTEI